MTAYTRSKWPKQIARTPVSSRTNFSRRHCLLFRARRPGLHNIIISPDISTASDGVLMCDIWIFYRIFMCRMRLKRVYIIILYLYIHIFLYVYLPQDYIYNNIWYYIVYTYRHVKRSTCSTCNPPPHCAGLFRTRLFRPPPPPNDSLLSVARTYKSQRLHAQQRRHITRRGPSSHLYRYLLPTLYVGITGNWIFDSDNVPYESLKKKSLASATFIQCIKYNICTACVILL